MGINIGNGNKILKSTIAERIETDEKKSFFIKHPFVCSFLVSLAVGILLLFSFWRPIIACIEGWFYG